MPCKQARQAKPNVALNPILGCLTRENSIPGCLESVSSDQLEPRHGANKDQGTYSLHGILSPTEVSSHPIGQQ